MPISPEALGKAQAEELMEFLTIDSDDEKLVLVIEPRAGGLVISVGPIGSRERTTIWRLPTDETLRLYGWLGVLAAALIR